VSDAILRAEDVSVQFGRVTALRNVSLALPPASVTCLLGDNGAGKSTLIKVLAGVQQPAAGRLLLNGAPVQFSSPRVARNHGIATVYQDLALLPLMSVWRNFVLGAEPTRGIGPLRWLDVPSCRGVALAEIKKFGVVLPDAERHVGTLSGGERQCVAIARALHFGARVLILDEPTAALGVKQVELVLAAVHEARSRGTAVLLITHNPQHALAAADRLVIMRHGEITTETFPADVSVEALSRLMAG
jgi:simple sugar transport system ATP-binding protein